MMSDFYTSRTVDYADSHTDSKLESGEDLPNQKETVPINLKKYFILDDELKELPSGSSISIPTKVSRKLKSEAKKDLIKAIKLKSYAKVKEAVAKGADVQSHSLGLRKKGEDAHTNCLMTFAFDERFLDWNIICYLLVCGALHAKRALAEAIELNELHVVEFIIDHCADRAKINSHALSIYSSVTGNILDITTNNAVEIKRETPLCRAIRLEHEEIVDVLLKKGADPDRHMSKARSQADLVGNALINDSLNKHPRIDSSVRKAAKKEKRTLKYRVKKLFRIK